MEQSSSSKSYEFVVSSSDAGLPTDQGTRRLIRRQAMSRAAAARKQKGSWGQHNLGQYPVSYLDLEDKEGAGDDAAASERAREGSGRGQQRHTPAMTAKMTVPASVPSSGYESMRIEYGFDLVDVSALTTFHSGRITARLLSREPFRLAHVLQYRQWSYFSFLPSRYGHTACLDDAANCVAARVRQWMNSPSEPPCKSVLSLYTKSLTSLQSALNDPVHYLKPEVLCATAILAIYELFDSTGAQAWVRHVAGSTALLKLRGPQRYQTDFEKALFISQAGPVYTEALLNDDVCFLEQESWQNVFRSVASETDALSDSSEIVVLLWTIVCRIPGLFKEVQNAVCNPTGIDMGIIGSLFARVRETSTLLLQWRREFDALSPSHISSEPSRDSKYYETFGVYLVNLMVINRLLVSLNPRAGLELEEKAQDLAHQILQLELTASATNPRASMFMAFKLVAAQACLDTNDEWHQAITLSVEDPTYTTLLISSQVFERWVKLKGRRITNASATTTESI